MNLIDQPQPPTVNPAKAIADSMLAHPNAEMKRRIEHHAMLYHMFWDSPETPAAIAEHMGDKAVAFLLFAGANIEQFHALASGAGKQLSDFISEADWMPRLPLTANADGTVTVQQVEGLDAWGRPIPQPTPVPQPDQETTVDQPI